MFKLQELPDCSHQDQPILVTPSSPTPRDSLYLSNLDDQKFLRFSIKYLYLFKKHVGPEKLRASLSRVLVDYYPLAGRLRTTSTEHDQKLEVDCNGEGAVFVEASMEITCDELLEVSRKPNRSWRKLLYKVQAQSFVDVPPLVVQVTKLRCGGMVLCTAINHCLCDGIGTSQFLHAWANIATRPNLGHPVVPPFHSRRVLSPRNPPQVSFTHPEYAPERNGPSAPDINKYLQSKQLGLVPISMAFTSSHLLRLKRQCVPPLKCTAFEALAAHTWRSWVKSLDLPPSLNVKLLFSVNVRKKLVPQLTQGYYGNGFVLGCAQTAVGDLVAGNNLHHGVKLVQQAKSILGDEYVRSMVDLLEDKTVKTDLSTSLVISQWSRLGLEELDFGDGKPLHMGPLTSDIYCLFLPVIGDYDAVRVLLSLPAREAERFDCCMKELLDIDQSNGDANGFHDGQEDGF